MNLAKLRLEASEREIPGYSMMSKAELLKALYGIEEDHRTFAQLRGLANAVGIPGYSTMYRAELLKALRDKEDMIRSQHHRSDVHRVNNRNVISIRQAVRPSMMRM